MRALWVLIIGIILIVGIIAGGLYAYNAMQPQKLVTGYYNDLIESDDGTTMAFVDDHDLSYDYVIHYGDTTPYSSQYTPNGWIDYVQKLNFIDDDGEEFFTPEQTIKRGGGDCEDKAALMARGLNDKGFDVILLVLNSHVICAVSKEQVDSHYQGIEKETHLNYPFWTPDTTYVDTTTGKEYYVVESTEVVNIGAFYRDLDVMKVYYFN